MADPVFEDSQSAGTFGMLLTSIVTGIIGYLVGDGFIGAALGAALGAGGGYLLKGVFENLALDHGLAGNGPPKRGGASADRSVSTRRAVSINLGNKEGQYNGYTEVPKMDSFRAISTDMQGMLSELGPISELNAERMRIEALPDDEKTGAKNKFKNYHDKAVKLVLNINKWNKLAETYNQEELPKLANAYKKHKDLLGETVSDGELVGLAAPVIKMSEMPALDPEMKKYAENLFGAASGQSFERAFPTSIEQMNFLGDRTDALISRYENEKTGIDWDKTLSQGLVQDRSDIPSKLTSRHWWSPLGPGGIPSPAFIMNPIAGIETRMGVMHDYVHTVTDCSHWCRHYMEKEQYDDALYFAELGKKKAQNEPNNSRDDDTEAVKEYSKVIGYIKALKARKYLNAAYDEFYQQVQEIENLPTQQFVPYIEKIEAFESEVKNSNQKLKDQENQKTTATESKKTDGVAINDDREARMAAALAKASQSRKPADEVPATENPLKNASHEALGNLNSLTIPAVATKDDKKKHPLQSQNTGGIA